MLPEELIPHYSDTWEIGVLYGPHGAPDFFTDEDIETFFAVDWKVHYNSSRSGVRLIGPKPHGRAATAVRPGCIPPTSMTMPMPSAAVDFTGDMPVILGPDGPSLGGFVCPVTIVQAELWKMGQLKPGDSVRFCRMSMEQALALEKLQDAHHSRTCGYPKSFPQVREPAKAASSSRIL